MKGTATQIANSILKVTRGDYVVLGMLMLAQILFIVFQEKITKDWLAIHLLSAFLTIAFSIFYIMSSTLTTAQIIVMLAAVGILTIASLYVYIDMRNQLMRKEHESRQKSASNLSGSKDPKLQNASTLLAKSTYKEMTGWDIAVALLGFLMFFAITVIMHIDLN